MFVIANIETGKGYERERYAGVAKYETERGAKAACTRLNKKVGKEQYKVMELEKYTVWRELQGTKMKTVINLMSGLPVVIPEDTPMSCDPSTETYWSM